MKMRLSPPLMAALSAAALAVVVALPAAASNSLSRAPMQDVIYLAEIASIRHSAETGEAIAQFILGNRYYRGDEKFRLAQDYNEAWNWYTKAARQGHAGAAYNLGVMRVQGNGVQRDLIEALAWFNIAANQGHGLSKELIPELEALLKPQHISAAQVLTMELVPQVVHRSRQRS